MDCKAQSCAFCGSGALKLISHKLADGNVFYTYRCEACGETFSTETAYYSLIYNEKCLSAIYFGFNVNPKSEKRIRNKLKKEKINCSFYKSFIDDKSFYIQYKPI